MNKRRKAVHGGATEETAVPPPPKSEILWRVPRHESLVMKERCSLPHAEYAWAAERATYASVATRARYALRAGKAKRILDVNDIDDADSAAPGGGVQPNMVKGMVDKFRARLEAAEGAARPDDGRMAEEAGLAGVADAATYALEARVADVALGSCLWE